MSGHTHSAYASVVTDADLLQEIEQCFLGILLINDAAYDEIPWMRDIYFYTPVHGRIFNVIQKLREGGKSTSPQIVAQYFTSEPELDQVGGARYLVDMAANVLSSASVKGYADQIYTAHLRRSMVALGQNLQELSLKASIDTQPKDLLARAEKYVSDAMEIPPDAQAHMAGHGLDRLIADIKNPKKGISTGFKFADKKMHGFQPGNLYILAGRPGMGKTAMALSLAANAAEDGYKVKFFSLEMTHDQLVSRLLSRYSGENVHGKSVEDWDAVEAAKAEVEALQIMVDASSEITVADISSRIRRHKRTFGCDIVFIDYLGLITPTDRTPNKTHQIEEITASLKRLAKQIGVAIVLLSQLSRAVESRDDKRPMLSDLRDSGSIEQDADVVMFVYREEYYLRMEKPQADKFSGKDKQASVEADWHAKLEKCEGKGDLIIAKLRQGETGTIRLQFDGRRQLFHD